MLMLSHLTSLLLLLCVSQDVISFSLSRLLYDFPIRPEISSFFSTFSSTLRDSPRKLIDIGSLNGLDGSRLQPPFNGGGGSHSAYLSTLGDEGWKKGLLAIPLLHKNDTESPFTIKYLSNSDGNYRIRGKSSTDVVEDSLIKKWWQRNTKDSKGLLIYLFPAVCAQLSILRTAVPFFLDRLSQYLQPIYMGLSFLLLQNRGASIIQATLWTSVLIGKILSYGRVLFCDYYIGEWFVLHVLLSSFTP